MPVEIADWNDLDNVRNDLTGDYVLVNDLDSETDGYAGIGDDFERLGVYGADGNSFTGTFDGDGHKILDLIISDDGNDARGHGLFGGVEGTVQNLSLDIEVDTTGFEASPDARPSALGLVFDVTTGTKIENVSVSGLATTQDDDSRSGGLLAGTFNDEECEIINCTSSVTVTVPNGDRVGGLVGSHDTGTITDSYVTGSVEGDSDVGGLVGRNDDKVTDSHATGSVDGDFHVGGLVGENQDTITDSYATGLVEGGDRAGGLVGQDSGDKVTDSYATGSVDGDSQIGGLAGRSRSGTVTDSYATGSVEGDERVGGLVGQHDGDTITDSYATGSVKGVDFVGGLVGRNDEGTVTDSHATGSVDGDFLVGGLVGTNNDTVTDSYWDTEATGQDTSDGGTGLTTAEMQGSEAESNMDDFDFADVWDTVLESDDDASADGYPILIVLDRENQLDAQGIFVEFILSVETNPATDVSEFSATLNGELVELDDEGDDADVFFEFGEDVTDGQTLIQTLTEPGAFDELVDELTNNTTFEFRAVAEAQDADGETFTDEGDVLTFTTDETQIDIQTDGATDVETFEATLNGEVVNLGAYDSAETFFEYGSINVDDEVTDVSIIETAQTLSEVVELAQDSEYEFRAVAIGENDDVRYEGDILTFDTEIVTLDGTISLDEVGVENADVLVHNFTQDVFEGRLSTDADGNYAVDLPDADRLDTVAVAVDFDDGTERYGRVVTTVLE